jgi:transcriptional regulator with XRE-family HTH domain
VDLARRARDLPGVRSSVVGMSNINPSSAYRELGRLLLRIREDSGLTAAELARGLEWTTTMVSRMENGRRISTTPDVVMYVVKCGLTLREAMPLVELCRIAERKEGYYLSDARVGGSLQSLIFHEVSAKHSITYEPIVIPGLLAVADTRLRACTHHQRRTPNLGACNRTVRNVK